MLHLTDDDVRKALPWGTLIPAMELALASFSRGEVHQPLRQWLPAGDAGGFWGMMPAVSPEVMGIKLVSFYPQNEWAGLPTVMALVLLVRPDTGEPIGILEGGTLTARRTAAVSAAVTKHLASPSSRVLAILGSGAEAQSHLEALRFTCEFDEVRVWSRTREHAARFAEANGAIAMEAETAVRGADIVVAATGTQTPVLQGAWLKPGAHVNSIGAPMPTWRELDDEAMGNCVVVESREAAMAESGDIILSGCQIRAEIGEIFAGECSIDSSETTVYKSVGVAVEDVVAASLAMESFARKYPGKVRR